MRKFTFLLLTACVFLTVFLSAFFMGCNKPTLIKIDGDYVIIKIDKDFKDQNTTLLQYMDILKEENKLDYEIKDGMIVSINSKKGSASKYWMLYTDDEANSNSAWGICEYEQKVYASASLGADSLIVNSDYCYIWYLQAF